MLNNRLWDGSTVARHVMDNALRVSISLARSESEMISVKTSNGRLGDWSESILAIVEVRDNKEVDAQLEGLVSHSHEYDWSVGSAPDTKRNQGTLVTEQCHSKHLHAAESCASNSMGISNKFMYRLCK